MKQLCFLAMLVCISLSGNAQNVGIGTTIPATRLTVRTPATGFGIEHSSSASNVVIKTYLNTEIGQIGTVTSHPFDIMSGNVNGQLRVMPTGVVGIGVDNPTLAGLVVNKVVGNTYGIFGNNTTGISLIGDWPGVGFNYYYNAGTKFMAAGFAGQLSFSPLDGQFIFASSSAAGTANATGTLNSRMSLYPDGGLTINGPNAIYAFKDRTLVNYAGWGWYADNGSARLYRFTSGGNVMTVDNIGNVGIGITSPAARLDVRATSGTYAAYVGQSGTGTGLGVGNNTSQAPALYATNSGGPAIIADGSVGIGNIFPKAGLFLDVKGRMRVKGIANDLNNSAGIYFDGVTTEQRAFIGMVTNDVIGIFGSVSQWSVGMNVLTGNLGVGTTAPNSKLQVAGGVSMPYRAITDNYTVTDDDYTIQFITSNNTGVVKTIYLPAASGRTGRIYKISAQIPFSGPAYCSDFTPSSVSVIESGTNINVIQQNISTQYSALAFYSCIHGVNGNTRRDTKQLSLTVQSNGAVWKVIEHNFWQGDFPN